MDKPQIKTVGDLIDLWASTPTGRARRGGGTTALAEDLGIPAATVRSMRFNNAIGRRYWSRIIECAGKHADSGTCAPAFNLVCAQLLVDIMDAPPPAKARRGKARKPKSDIIQAAE